MKRVALLVLGMHRGGTSAVAGLLVRLGAQGPRALMPPDADNPSGYWESTVLFDLHERLLRAAGSRWDSYTRLDLDWLRSGIAQTLSDECQDALRAEFGNAGRFVMKDPRMCRFVPFWLRTLEHEGIVPAAVLVVRDPIEVAQSLSARNGFERDLSLLIWLRHTLDAEFATRGVRRTFVWYRAVVENWKPVAERVSRDLQIAWRPRTSADDEDIGRFVSAGLHHHRQDVDSHEDVAPVLAEWLRRTLAALRHLRGRECDASEVLAELDAVRLEFDRATSAIGDVADRVRGGLEVEVEGLEARIRNLEADVGNLEALRAGLQSALHAHGEQLDTLERALSAAHQDAQALRESASWRITAPLRSVYRLFR